MRQGPTEILAIKAAVRERDGRCVKCGLTNEDHFARHGRAMDVHRVVPASRYTAKGCVTMCKRCHGSEPKSKPGEGDPRHCIRLPLSYREPVRRAAARRRITITMVIAIALEEHLAEVGLWPPQSAKGGE